jgi:hypothetical protein
MKFLRALTYPVTAAALVAVATTCAPEAQAQQLTGKAGPISVTLFIPEGVTKLKGLLAFTSAGLGSGWSGNEDFRALAKRLDAGVVAIRGEDAFNDPTYPTRCARGEFKNVLDALADLAKNSGHPEVANAPLVGSGHSHGGDYWNYFNACYPERMALVFCKASGGVQYLKGALRTPMIWETGTGDLRDSRGFFRGAMMAHRGKGTAMSLVIGPGEGHGGFTAGSRQLVIDLMEGIFRLRVPADADAAAGPVVLRDIDESSGAYWLGDNYSKEIGAYPGFAGKEMIARTSFLPSAEVAAKWKAYGANLPADIKIDGGGICTSCYKPLSTEPELKPINAGPAPTPPVPDAGSGGPDSGSATAPGDAGSPPPTPSPTPPPPSGPTTPAPNQPDAGVPPPRSPPPAPTPSTSGASGGCTFAGAPGSNASSSGLAPLALLLLALGAWVWRRGR